MEQDGARRSRPRIFPPISSWAPALHRRFADQQGILRYARVFHRRSQQAVTDGEGSARLFPSTRAVDGGREHGSEEVSDG